ncbi:NIN-like protein, partial [Tanacetum coccineum]
MDFDTILDYAAFDDNGIRPTMEFRGEPRYLTPLSLSENGEELSQSDSSESVINSARDNVNSTINPDAGLEITNDTITGGGENSNYMKRRRKRKTDSLTMEAVEKYVGKPIDEAAMSLAGNRSTLKRFCRDHGMLSWPFPKHKKRTVDVADSKVSRKSKSSQNLQLSLGAPFGLFDVVLLLVRIKRWRKRNAIQYAMQNNDLLVMSAEQDNNKASKKRKRIDLSISLEE